MPKWTACHFFVCKNLDLSSKVFKELRKAVQGCHDLHLASIEVIGTGWMYATEGTVQEQLQRQQQQQQQEDAQQGDEGKGLVCKGTELQKEMETGLAGKGGPTGLGPFPAPLLPPPSTAKSASQRCDRARRWGLYISGTCILKSRY